MTPEQREKLLAGKREYYRKNKEKHQANMKAWYLENKQKILAERKEEREQFPEVVKERKRKFYQKHKVRILEEMHDRYDGLSPEAKKHKQEVGKDWIRRNRERYLEYLKWWRTQPQHRMARVMGHKIRVTLKGIVAEDESLRQLIGCSGYNLRKHLENQFKEGMSWDNYTYDGWHVDHIKPYSAFDLTDPAQQKLCFHYTNLQPLWGTINSSKGCKSPEEWEKYLKRKSTQAVE